MVHNSAAFCVRCPWPPSSLQAAPLTLTAPCAVLACDDCVDVQAVPPSTGHYAHKRAGRVGECTGATSASWNHVRGRCGAPHTCPVMWWLQRHQQTSLGGRVEGPGGRGGGVLSTLECNPRRAVLCPYPPSSLCPSSIFPPSFAGTRSSLCSSCSWDSSTSFLG